MVKKKIKTYEHLYRDYRRLFKNDSKAFDVYRKAIHLMHLICQDVTRRRAKELRRTKTYVTGSPAITQLYFLKILHFFMAHYTLMKEGMIMASYSPLRTIHETILKSYLCIIDPNMGEINYKYELGNSLPENERLKIEKKMGSMKYLSMSYVEPKLYSESIRKDARKFYNEICALVHPSIKSLGCCFEIKEQTFLDSAKLGVGLSACAFTLLFEIHWNYIRPSYKKRFLKMSEAYPSLIPEGIPHLVPDKSNDCLSFKEYNDLIKMLQTM